MRATVTRAVLGAFGVIVLAPGLIQAYRTGTLVARLLVIAATAGVFFQQRLRTQFRWAPILATALAAGLILAPFQVGLGSRTISYGFALGLTGLGVVAILGAWFDD